MEFKGFPTPSSEFVYTRTYSRWIDDLNRRETWPETVDRVINFLKEERGDKVPEKVFKKLRKYMLSFDVLPSMRLVWAAGPAAKSDSTALYNCSFLPVDSVESFAETLYILMQGTGVGYSVQSKFTEKLPIVSKVDYSARMINKIQISDDKKGWADSVKELMFALYKGEDIEFDYSIIRPKGARLKTMGGRASGPEPLVKLHAFIRDVFSKAQGRKLTPLECSDIMNEIAEIVVVGGVRRSSEICLSDLDSEEMRSAKDWPFPPRRFMSNNSAVYEEKPSAVKFLKEWTSLAASGTGERGIFNLSGARKTAPKRRNSSMISGTNPCGEIMLRENSFCNLSTIIVKENDDLDTLLDKAETASWIGTIQSSFTHFPYLRSVWKENCEEERLLGVSVSGQMDNPAILTADALKAMKTKAIKINKRAAKTLGINESAAITSVKPEGTSSQLTNSGSGLHVWYSPYFIRRYRISGTDPLYRLMRDSGFEFKPENGQTEENAQTWVVSFPVKAPETAKFRKDVTAIDQLEWYKHVQTNWCEHNASCTIYVKENEWLEVGNWVYQNWDIINGVSFLPYDGGHYEQAPYEEITEEKYNKLLKLLPKIDYSLLSTYEKEDSTEGAKSYACVGDKCELK